QPRGQAPARPTTEKRPKSDIESAWLGVEMAETHEFQTIEVEVDGPLGRLTLNRPGQLNAIDATMLHELVEAARWFDSHRELRVVILSGAGRAFTAGADLKGSSVASGAPRSKQSWLDRR